MTSAREIDPCTLVDLDRYPVHEPGSRGYRELVQTCRARMRETGACPLPGFVRPGAVRTMVEEIEPELPLAWFCREPHNAYLRPDPDPAFAPEHPRNRLLETEVGSIAGDDLPPSAAIRALYGWDRLTGFIAAVLGLDRLHRLADPLGAVSVNVFVDGGGHAWHFDESRFTVTVLLRAPESGGVFEYVPNVRADDDDAFQAVGRVLDGEHREVHEVPFIPGTLFLFAGHHTLHRVTKTRGPVARLVPVLCYDPEPGRMNSDAVRRLFWGRATARPRPEGLA